MTMFLSKTRSIERLAWKELSLFIEIFQSALAARSFIVNSRRPCLPWRLLRAGIYAKKNGHLFSLLNMNEKPVIRETERTRFLASCFKSLQHRFHKPAIQLTNKRKRTFKVHQWYALALTIVLVYLFKKRSHLIRPLTAEMLVHSKKLKWKEQNKK